MVLVTVPEGTFLTSGITATVQSGVFIASGLSVIPTKSASLITAIPILATAASGGQELGGATAVDRVIIRIPELKESGNFYKGIYENSGTCYGVWIGGKSGYAPYQGSGFIGSGFGIWCPAGTQKELYVKNLNEIYVCGEPSGYPVTYVAEVQ